MDVQATALPDTPAIGYDSRMLKPITPFCECGRRAVRFVTDRWPYSDGRYRTLGLCDRCPSPAEIDQRAAKVREGWSDQEHYAKHFGCSLAQLEYRQRVDVVVCSVMDDE